MVLNYHFMSTRDAENGDNPLLAMKDESTGNRYLRAVGQKGVEGMEWLVKDLHEELKSWGHMGGAGGNIVIKTDGEASIAALRDAATRYHGGIVAPEPPPYGGESGPLFSRRQRTTDAQFDQGIFGSIGR